MHTEDRGKTKELFSQNAFSHRPKDINIQAGPHFKALVNYASQADCPRPLHFDPQSRLKKVAGSLLVVIPNDQHFAILLRRKLQASAVGAAPFDKLRHLLPVDAGRLKAKLEAGRDAYRRRVRIVRRRVETKREQRALGEGEGARLSAVDGPGAGRDLLTDGEGVAHDFK